MLALLETEAGTGPLTTAGADAAVFERDLIELLDAAQPHDK